MFDFKSQDAKHSDASLDAGLTPAATSGASPALVA